MDILKISIEPFPQDADGEQWYCVSVKVQSSPTHYKAYQGNMDKYPDRDDIAKVAATGRKIYEQWRAEQIFGVTTSLHFEC
jgi:hypothetical protein